MYPTLAPASTSYAKKNLSSAFTLRRWQTTDSSNFLWRRSTPLPLLEVVLGDVTAKLSSCACVGKIRNLRDMSIRAETVGKCRSTLNGTPQAVSQWTGVEL